MAIILNIYKFLQYHMLVIEFFTIIWLTFAPLWAHFCLLINEFAVCVGPAAGWLAPSHPVLMAARCRSLERALREPGGRAPAHHAPLENPAAAAAAGRSAPLLVSTPASHSQLNGPWKRAGPPSAGDATAVYLQTAAAADPRQGAV